MNLTQQPLGNPSKYKTIFANRKVEIIAGVSLVGLLLCFLWLSPFFSFFSDTTESQLRSIYAERADARIEKSNFLAQEISARAAIAEWETVLLEAQTRRLQSDQRLIELLQAEVQLGEDRAVSISNR